jgi:hypothetical protein
MPKHVATTNIVNVIEQQPYISIPMWSMETRPLNEEGKPMVGLNTTTGYLEWHNGSSWVSAQPISWGTYFLGD